MGPLFQVPESTAEILAHNGVPCEFRSNINVKGKGPMNVYLVSDACALYTSTASLERLDSSNPRDTGL